MALAITPLYAGLLGLVFAVLSAEVIRARARANVSVGDGGDPGLMLAMRVQGNFVEYVPFALLLIAMAEIQGAPGWALHGLGAVLLLSRVMHALGLRRSPSVPPLRGGGFALSLLVLVIAAALNILYALN
ncbi:hypothetical protein SAMN05216196_105291 [Lutimaribacter pacificus]|uniref:MAPEG family protein n=1 Tax=Lutimaribacter pacificus TaxID=391948 RepID=A0A1H0JHV1_9RHOB|nr:MAPEG family protein [Lutimaribacter pacificus]SDO43375.1 hypothetical protein SAMN05216196_105291 [Lutimaribacter pacificus]SHK09905.1 hypothetical protein SAMN05444142_103249 [Lutimaribacter pacificus]